MAGAGKCRPLDWLIVLKATEESPTADKQVVKFTLLQHVCLFAGEGALTMRAELIINPNDFGISLTTLHIFSVPPGRGGLLSMPLGSAVDIFFFSNYTCK